MSHSVKFADAALIDDARLEAGLQSRSLASQLTHWARIGRAIERSDNFNHAKLFQVLSGKLETSALSHEEKAVWSEQFVLKMSGAGPDEEAFYTEMRKSGKAVGLDAAGRIVHADTKQA
ncbi:TA system antitoxin ParD family protein [Pacificimonas sp. ICDLI1SI03]